MKDFDLLMPKKGIYKVVNRCAEPVCMNSNRFEWKEEIWWICAKNAWIFTSASAHNFFLLFSFLCFYFYHNSWVFRRDRRVVVRSMCDDILKVSIRGMRIERWYLVDYSFLILRVSSPPMRIHMLFLSYAFFFTFFFVFERDCNLCKFLKRNESLFLISNWSEWSAIKHVRSRGVFSLLLSCLAHMIRLA